MDCNFLMKDRLHSIISKGCSEWSRCSLSNWSISQSAWQLLLSHSAVATFPESYCNSLPDLSLLISYSYSFRFHLPVPDTRPCPSTTGHGSAGNYIRQLRPPPNTARRRHFSWPPGCPRISSFLHHNHMQTLVINVWDMGGSQGVFKGSIVYNFPKTSKVTCCSPHHNQGMTRLTLPALPSTPQQRG